MSLYFSKEELYSDKGAKIYPGDASMAAFLLGGIGTGNISLYANGRFADFEIFNTPDKGTKIPYSFFALRTKEEGCDPFFRVLEAPQAPPYQTWGGYMPGEVIGLPHMESSSMTCEYPFARVAFTDSRLPVTVCMEAFTPFIPLKADDSGIPAFTVKYRVTNQARRSVEVTLAGSMTNLCGTSRENRYIDCFDHNIRENILVENEDLKGIMFCTKGVDEDALNFGNMCLLSPDKDITLKREWLCRGWWDGLQEFVDDLTEDGRLILEPDYIQKQCGNERHKELTGSVGSRAVLQPGESRDFTFILSWYQPNRVDGWLADKDGNHGIDCKTRKNHYAVNFKDSLDAAGYVYHTPHLESLSRDFSNALYHRTALPDYVIESMAAGITTLRSPTCFWLDDGTFCAFEGCNDHQGSCHGTCTHVWNYEQTLAFLFPELERNLRETEFLRETDGEGRMAFRAESMFGGRFDYHPAADGQLGTIIRLYRDWKLSGDDDFLRKVFPSAMRTLDFAFSYWDSDGDSVLDSQQHNTYDIEFYGPNSMINSVFFAALKAAALMSEHLGETERAEHYQRVLKSGQKKMDNLLWSGEYYIQALENVDEYRYQYGTGCLSDQLLGQQLAHVAGLGYILPEEHVKSAMQAVYKYNFKDDFFDHNNAQRVYALNDEKGLVLCSWPNGGRPKLPFVYSDEVWTGVEAQVAVHLIYEGMIDEGLSVIRAVRDRHDGYRRNPWSEAECGHHYARSMAGWGALIALSGMQYDMTENHIGFDPKINCEEFTCFYSTGKEWGVYNRKSDSCEVLFHM